MSFIVFQVLSPPAFVLRILSTWTNRSLSYRLQYTLHELDIYAFVSMS